MAGGRVRLGKTGEDVACQELERRGYAVLARRYRRRGGEVDIVAQDGQTIVFVEVKARDGSQFGEGAEAVTRLKQQRIVRVAVDYLARHRLMDRPCRFDVMSIRFGEDEPIIDIFQNAFLANE
jgi:putative endonuclease